MNDPMERGFPRYSSSSSDSDSDLEAFMDVGPVAEGGALGLLAQCQTAFQHGDQVADIVAPLPDPADRLHPEKSSLGAAARAAFGQTGSLNTDAAGHFVRTLSANGNQTWHTYFTVPYRDLYRLEAECAARFLLGQTFDLHQRVRRGDDRLLFFDVDGQGNAPPRAAFLALAATVRDTLRTMNVPIAGTYMLVCARFKAEHMWSRHIYFPGCYISAAQHRAIYDACSKTDSPIAAAIDAARIDAPSLSMPFTRKATGSRPVLPIDAIDLATGDSIDGPATIDAALAACRMMRPAQALDDDDAYRELPDNAGVMFRQSRSAGKRDHDDDNPITETLQADHTLDVVGTCAEGVVYSLKRPADAVDHILVQSANLNNPERFYGDINRALAVRRMPAVFSTWTSKGVFLGYLAWKARLAASHNQSVAVQQYVGIDTDNIERFVNDMGEATVVERWNFEGHAVAVTTTLRASGSYAREVAVIPPTSVVVGDLQRIPRPLFGVAATPLRTYVHAYCRDVLGRRDDAIGINFAPAMLVFGAVHMSTWFNTYGQGKTMPITVISGEADCFKSSTLRAGLAMLGFTNNDGMYAQMTQAGLYDASHLARGFPVAIDDADKVQTGNDPGKFIYWLHTFSDGNVRKTMYTQRRNYGTVIVTANPWFFQQQQDASTLSRYANVFFEPVRDGQKNADHVVGYRRFFNDMLPRGPTCFVELLGITVTQRHFDDATDLINSFFEGEASGRYAIRMSLLLSHTLAFCDYVFGAAARDSIRAYLALNAVKSKRLVTTANVWLEFIERAGRFWGSTINHSNMGILRRKGQRNPTWLFTNDAIKATGWKNAGRESTAEALISAVDRWLSTHPNAGVRPIERTPVAAGAYSEGRHDFLSATGIAQRSRDDPRVNNAEADLDELLEHARESGPGNVRSRARVFVVNCDALQEMLREYNFADLGVIGGAIEQACHSSA